MFNTIFPKIHKEGYKFLAISTLITFVILFFSKLGKSHIAKIVEIQLKNLRKKLSNNNICIEWTSKVNNLLALTGFDPDYGARPIKREIRNVIEDTISELIITNQVKDGKTLLIDAVDNKKKKKYKTEKVSFKISKKI